MKTKRGARCLVHAALVLFAIPAAVGQQRTPEVRRAQPVEEPPVAKAVPFNPPAPSARPRTSVPPPVPEPNPNTQLSNPEQPPSESAPVETEAPDRRQLDYANGLFSRKLYDLAIPEYEKFLAQYPGVPGGRAPTFI